MDWKLTKKQMNLWWSKYKYVLAVLLLGLVLMNLPPAKEKTVLEEATPVPTKMSISEELEQILSRIDGVGRVEVMITEESGSETVYQTDLDESLGNDTTSRREKTVMRTSGSGEEGLVRTVIPASYRGAVVVCQGGGNPAVNLAVIQAVSKVTGISTDRIAVLKMK